MAYRSRAKRVLNFGSLNIDMVYQVERLVRAGETLAAADYRRFAGGKGFNQSIALARAGGCVSHAGRIGQDGQWLRDMLAAEGADVGAVEVSASASTGHAMIQVTPSGENAILIHGGANQTLDEAFVDRAFEHQENVDFILLQNETSAVPEILAAVGARRLPVAFNAAPMTAEVANLPLGDLAILFVNETEAASLAGPGQPEAVIGRLAERYPETLCILTAGRQGAWAARGGETWHEPARQATAVDTTGAGDTFVGYFLAEYLASVSVEAALAVGNQAAALSVTRPGAADSIPRRSEWIG